MGTISCPNCGKEVSTVHVHYECADGHTWSEAVDLPEKKPMMTFKRPHADHSDVGGHDVRLTMPFGKHKGEYIENLDTDYIQWCLENLERISPRIKQEMENQLILRGGGGVKR